MPGDPEDRHVYDVEVRGYGHAPERDEATLRPAYGPVRAHVRANPEQYATLRRRLNQARYGVSYDRYAARAVREAVAVAGAGLLVGLALALLAAGRPGALAAVFVPLGALVAGGGWAAYRYYRPLVDARRRERAIEAALPHAVVFLYALTHGGLDLFEVMDRLAEAEETYGPVAREFELAVTDARRFDMDLFTALEHARDLTPSESLETFLDELVSVLRTGGDVDEFLSKAADAQLEAAEEKQQELMEDLGLVAQGYVSAVFAGPAFLLVVFLVIGMVSGGALVPLRVLTYLAIPAALLAFGVGVHYLNRPFRNPGASGQLADGAPDPPEFDDGRLEAYLESRERSMLDRLRETPIETLRSRPRATFAATVPLAALFALALVATGTLPASPSALVDRPVVATAGLIAVPALIAATPFAALDELEARRRRAIRERFPDALRVLADASDNEVPLVESFALVSRRTTGALSRELERVRADAAWSRDARGALRRFADRLGVPEVSRIVRLLVDAMRATGDLSRVFRVVADDLHARNRLTRERRREMYQYVAVVTVGLFVYLAIVAMFEVFFLPFLARAGAEGTTVQGTPVAFRATDIDAYRTVLFHSALVQAAGNGLLLGKLVDDRAASGVKFAVAYVALTTLVFLALAAVGRVAPPPV